MRKISSLLLLLVLIVFPALAFATAQQPDVLILDGKQYAIYTNPLEPYLTKYPDLLPKSNVISTSLWRRYVAQWEIKNGSLVLTDVASLQSINKPGERGSSTELVSVMKEMFPGQTEVVALWFTGHIIVPNGKLVHYVHMGYASTYKKYIILRVEQGLVTRKWTADTAGFIEFRNAQFEAFKKTDQYQLALAETSKEDGKDTKQTEEFLREFYSERYMSMIFDDRH